MFSSLISDDPEDQVFSPLLSDDSQILKPHYCHFPMEDISWESLQDSSSLSALLGKAIQGMLLEEEEKTLLDEINGCNSFPLHLIQKQQILALIETRSIVAVALLEKAIASPLASEYFQMFTTLAPSISSCDVIKQLFEKDLLPKEIIELFVANALDHIRSIHDAGTQKRLAQLVCIFVNSILSLYSYLLEDLAIELEYFLIEFSQLKECADLFRVLKAHQKEGKF